MNEDYDEILEKSKTRKTNKRSKKEIDNKDKSTVKDNVNENVGGDDNLTKDDTSEYTVNKNSPILEAEPIEREYTKVRSNINPDTIGSLPEPDFEPPQINIGDESPDLETKEKKSTTDDFNIDDLNIEDIEKDARGDTKNPALSNESNAGKKKAAAYLADSAIAAYEMINDYALKYATYDDAWLEKKAIEGKIDLSILEFEIPISERTNQTITVKEFLDNLNQQSSELFVVTDEFKTEARELLIEIFAKRGWGLSVEQRLGLLVIQDIVPKIQGLYVIKTQVNQILKATMQIIVNDRKNNEQTKETQNDNNEKVNTDTKTDDGGEIIVEDVDADNDKNK